MRNVHEMFITYIHRTQESRNPKNTYDFLVHVRNFLLPLSLKVLRHKERDTHSFYSGFSICPPPNTCTPVQGLREQAKVNCLLPRQVSTELTFSKIPKSSVRFRWVTSFALASPVSHLGLCDISVNTCVNAAHK